VTVCLLLQLTGLVASLGQDGGLDGRQGLEVKKVGVEKLEKV
jgi:hypothetical protein